MTIATGAQALAADILHSLNADGYMSFAASSTLTIATGAITASKNWYVVATEGAASTDDLDTITAGTNVDDGHLLFLRAADDAKTVVVKHNTGNILLIDSADISLDDKQDICVLVYDSGLTKWCGFSGTLGNRTVSSAQLALNSVDDTIAGNRVPQFIRRQGGDASSWDTRGTTNYTPTAVRMQTGTVATSGAVGDVVRRVVITFPVAFSQIPIVHCSMRSLGGTQAEESMIGTAESVLTTGFTLAVRPQASGTFGSADPSAQWLAIGTE